MCDHGDYGLKNDGTNKVVRCADCDLTLGTWAPDGHGVYVLTITEDMPTHGIAAGSQFLHYTN